MVLTVQLWQRVANRFDLHQNIAWINDLIKQDDSVDILAFPECALWGPIDSDHSYPSQEDVEAGILELQETCETFGKRVILGTPYPIIAGIENRAYLLGEREPQYYTKVHVHWSEEFTPGNNFPTFQYKDVKLGLLVCFDIAFPEAARILTLKGIQILSPPPLILFILAITKTDLKV
jgi:predicted amidohydrolase